WMHPTTPVMLDLVGTKGNADLLFGWPIDTSPVKVTLPLSFCYTPGLLHRLSAGGHHAGQSVRTFCGEKSHFCDGAWHTGTRPGSGATRYVVCPDRPEAVHPHCVVFDRL